VHVTTFQTVNNTGVPDLCCVQWHQTQFLCVLNGDI